MDLFFQWITQTPIAGLVLTILFGISVLGIVFIYLVAFMQGREISIWPPKIGAKPFLSINDKSNSNFGNSQNSNRESKGQTIFQEKDLSVVTTSENGQVQPKVSLPILHLIAQPIAILEGIDGSVHGNIFVILTSHRRLLVGNASDCDLRVESSYMSRHHCAILIKGTLDSKTLGRTYCFEIVDLQTTGGVFLNGTTLGGEIRTINDADFIQMGDCSFRFFILNKKIQ